MIAVCSVDSNLSIMASFVHRSNAFISFTDRMEFPVTFSTSKTGCPRWHRATLKAAAVYNVGWGLSAFLFPNATLSILGVDPLPNYPELWQCIGMIVGVYGIGYWCAAEDPVRHWPFVLVGLLGKILGPIGFLWSVMNGSFPWMMGFLIVVNDLIWWIPFVLMLRYTKQCHLASKSSSELGYPSMKGPSAAKRRGSSTVVRMTFYASSDT